MSLFRASAAASRVASCAYDRSGPRRSIADRVLAQGLCQGCEGCACRLARLAAACIRGRCRFPSHLSPGHDQIHAPERPRPRGADVQPGLHDVISPVGAIANGLEVLDDEDDAKMREVALDLVRRSAYQASAKLQFCRLAFGAAGSAGAHLDLKDAEAVTRGFLGPGQGQARMVGAGRRRGPRRRSSCCSTWC